MVLPLALLGGSAALAPYIFELAHFDQRRPASDIERLYRRGITTFFYTPHDLLQPKRFGAPGQYIDAVIFDVWAAGEGVSRPMLRLTWILQIARAFAGLSPEGAQSDPASSPDEISASSFLRTFAGPPAGRRGSVTRFDVRPDSPYRKESGVRLLFALAVKDPGDELPPPLRGSQTRLDVALQDTFAQAASAGVVGVGVPFMPLGPSLGERPPQHDAWRFQIAAVDAAARNAGVRCVLFGGFGVDQQSAVRTDEAFRDAYRQWRSTLQAERHAPTHQAIRLSAVVMLFGFLGYAWRGERFSLRRGLAIVAVSAVLATSVATLHGWLDPLLSPIMSEGVAVAVKAGLGVGAGLYMPYVVKFKPNEELEVAPPSADRHV